MLLYYTDERRLGEYSIKDGCKLFLVVKKGEGETSTASASNSYKVGKHLLMVRNTSQNLSILTILCQHLGTLCTDSMVVTAQLLSAETSTYVM